MNFDNFDNPGELIVLALVLGFVFAAVSAWREMHSQRHRNRPHVVLRRCRIGLDSLKRELRGLPADRSMHDLLRTIEHAEETMKTIEFEICRR